MEENKLNPLPSHKKKKIYEDKSKGRILYNREKIFESNFSEKSKKLIINRLCFVPRPSLATGILTVSFPPSPRAPQFCSSAWPLCSFPAPRMWPSSGTRSFHKTSSDIADSVKRCRYFQYIAVSLCCSITFNSLKTSTICSS